MNTIRESNRRSWGEFIRRPERNLLLWVILAALSFSFLPYDLWRYARWILAVLLIVEMGRLAVCKLRRSS